MNAPASLSIRALSKSFGATAVLNGLELTVPAGTLTAVLGPSGCRWEPSSTGSPTAPPPASTSVPCSPPAAPRSNSGSAPPS